MPTRRITIALVAIFGLTASLLPAAAAVADTIPVGTVSGVVTTAAGTLPSGTLRVWATTDGYNAAGASGRYGPWTIDPATGAYATSNLAIGKYYLELEYLGTENYPYTTYSPAVLAGGSRTSVDIVAGPQTVGFYLAVGATISGSLTTSDATTFVPNTPGLVRVVTAAGNSVNAAVSFDTATGAYVASRIPAGDVTVEFAHFETEWITEFWNSVTQVSNATIIHVDEGSTVTGVDAVVQRKPTVVGDLTIEGSGSPVVGITVELQREGDPYPTLVYPNSSGHFEAAKLDPGVYTLCVINGGSSDFLSECWNDGEAFTLVADQVLDLDWEIVEGGNLSGKVSYFSPAAGELAGATGTTISLYRLNEAGDAFEWYDDALAAPTFIFHALPPGTYAVHFLAMSAFQNELLLNSEYWEDARYWAQRTDLEIGSGDDVSLGEVVLSPWSLDRDRVEGADRFEVGVNVSKILYPAGQVPAEGVPVVYVANGYNFPDALTAGPAAARHGGAVLLVTPTSIPPSVAAELERLHPQRIVVSGGPASVSPAVFEQLQSYVDSPSDVFRAGGANRYEASRTIVRDAFEAEGADMAIITTGWNFPDALSAGPAAASQDAPVILVDGTASAIDTATRQLLLDLGIDNVYIAGGTASVSPGIESSLKNLLGNSNVVRFAGADRFAVGVMLAQEFFPYSEFTFLSTGYKFPDALTGGPLAAAYDAPLYLSRPDCIPEMVAFDIVYIDAQAMVLLGGPASLSPAVENLQLC